MTQRVIWTHGRATLAGNEIERGDTVPAKVWNELGTSKRRVLTRCEMVELIHDEDEGMG